MSKESLVHSFNGGKVLYVEPNDIYGYTKDDDGHVIPITPPYQDLCISFDLVADVYSRTNAGIRKAVKDETDNERKTSYVMSFHSKPRMDSQTFLKGTGYGSYDSKNGKFEDYYLTTYFSKREFGAYIADKQIVEGLGVESVEISMEHWYTPTIVINFVDVRGVALWGQEEAIRGDNGTISVENVFGSFFTLPYPVFHLMVKGFFGRPVTYQLSLSSFKGSYDMDGSFKVTATFIGYQYSLLTDIPMRYLVAAPFCEYEGKKYWDGHVNSNEWRLSDGSTPPKLYDFFENVKGAVFKAPQNEMGNLPDTTIVSLEKERRLLSEMNTQYNAVRNKLAYQGRKIIIDNDDVTHHETLYFFESPDKLVGNDTCLVRMKFDELFESIEALNKTVGSYKSQYGNLKGSFEQFYSMINNLIYGNVDDNSGGLIYNGEYFTLYRYFTYDDDNYKISDLKDASMVDSARVRDAVIAWFKKVLPFNDDMDSLKGEINPERWDVAKKRFFDDFIKTHGAAEAETKNVYIGYFKMYDASYQITQRIKEIDEEMDTIKESIDKNRNFDILEAIGFKPYIGDYLKIVMCHLETFVHIIKQSEIDAAATQDKRRLVNASWTDWNDQALRDGAPNVPCWVGVTKTETKLTEYDENNNHPTEGSVSWLGAFEDGSDEKFVETTVVNSLLKALACTITTPDEPQSQQEDSNTMTAYDYYPTLPFDFNNSENIFNGTLQEIYGNNPFQAIVGYIGLRICQLATCSQHKYDDDVVDTIAELDAYNWYKSYQNGTKFNEFLYEPLKAAANEDGIDDVVFNILGGFNPSYEKYKITNSNGSASYPYQILGGDKEQVMLRSVPDTDDMEASYVCSNGVVLTPTRFKPFIKYRQDCITVSADGRTVYPNYDENNFANQWITPNKMYSTNQKALKPYFGSLYNHDLCNIIDTQGVIGAIKDRFWLLKNRNKFVVSAEYTNEMPNYEKYLSTMYSNFDSGYEKWFYGGSEYGLALQVVMPSNVETQFQTPVMDRASFAKYRINANDYTLASDFKNKRLKVRARQKSDIERVNGGSRLADDIDESVLRNELLFETNVVDTANQSNKWERVNNGSIYFPTCAIYNETADGTLKDYTNLFMHTAYYNTPFEYMTEDESFTKYEGNELMRMRKLFRCAMFLFSFRYSSTNMSDNGFKYSGLKRMPKGLVLQLGAQAWWRKTFDYKRNDKYTANPNSDFPRYRSMNVLYPLVKTTGSEWALVYYDKGSRLEENYVTYKGTQLYQFTHGDAMYENMLCNRFIEFALSDRTVNNELVFDTIREKVELRMGVNTFDVAAERKYKSRIQQFGLNTPILYHKLNTPLTNRVMGKDENGANTVELLDWEHFAKAYRGIYVDGADLDGMFRFDGEMSGVQDILRSLYMDEFVLVTSVSPYEADDAISGECRIQPYQIKRYVRKLYDTWSDIAEKTASKMNVAYLSKMEGLSNNTDDGLEVIKIGIYNYIKNLYDKWLLQVDEEMFNVKNFYKTNFYFMTAYYENIYSKLVVNCQTVTDLYKNMTHEQSLFNYIDHVLSDHNCQLYITPDFIPFGQNLKENKEMLYDVFKPYAYHDLSLNSHYNGMNMASYANCNRFIAVLKSEIPNTVAPPTYTEYKQDGFTFVQDIGEKNEDGTPRYEGTDDLSNIFPTRNAELLNDKVNYNELRDNSVWDGAVPCFGVTMSRQGQHLFENVTLNMENPIVTDISARTYEDIVNVGKSGERRVYFHGQDIYKVYSAYSYGCSVTMLGNAQIQPLMYFQLNNIPMWHGAYMIYKVTHQVSVGDMKTTFEGQRVSRRRAVINQQFANGASLMDYSVKDDDVSNVLVGKQTCNSSTMNKLSHPINVKPFAYDDNPFKSAEYHETTNMTTQTQSNDPKYFSELEKVFNELVQLNREQKFGDTIKISSLYRQGDSTSDHSNPGTYKGRNSAMDLQISTANPRRNHCIDLCAPYLLYLLKRDCGRQILLEIGKPSSDSKENRQAIMGDDTYLHCFHVSILDGDLKRHNLPLGFMTWQERKKEAINRNTGKTEVSSTWNWHRTTMKVEDLPPTLAEVFIQYLDYCKKKNDIKTFVVMTRGIDFGSAGAVSKKSNSMNVEAVRDALMQAKIKNGGDEYSNYVRSELENLSF